MPFNADSKDKLHEAYRRFFVKTAVLMGANNDNNTLKSVDEVLDLQYKIKQVNKTRLRRTLYQGWLKSVI